jgi:hypothetical protein
MCVVEGLRAVDVSPSHQFKEEIGAASSENGLFIAKAEFSVQTLIFADQQSGMATASTLEYAGHGVSDATSRTPFRKHIDFCPLVKFPLIPQDRQGHSDVGDK